MTSPHQLTHSCRRYPTLGSLVEIFALQRNPISLRTLKLPLRPEPWPGDASSSRFSYQISALRGADLQITSQAAARRHAG